MVQIHAPRLNGPSLLDSAHGALTRVQRNALRRLQAEEKKARVLGRCRALMASGCFRPTATEICGEGGQHDVTNLFASLPYLYEVSLDDDTVSAIGRCVVGATAAGLALGELHRLARAAVFGRLST